MWSGPAPAAEQCNNPCCGEDATSTFVACVGGVVVLLLCAPCSWLFTQRFDVAPAPRAKRKSPDARTKKMDRKVLAFMEKGPGSRFSELASKLLVYSESQLRRSLDRLVASGALVRSGKNRGSLYHRAPAVAPRAFEAASGGAHLPAPPA